jgi:polysaccharide pyruvyl transferase WcaK-like protein
MRSILVANAWHDDNRGDSAISMATLRLLDERWPGSRIQVRTMLEPADPAYLPAFRHLSAEFPHVEFAGSLSPTLLAGTGLRRIRHLARWLAGVTRLAAQVLRGRPDPGIRRTLEGVDLLVLQGGSNLFDTGRGGFLGTARLLTLLHPAWAAQRLGIPTVFLGHTMGPFQTAASRRLARTVLGGASRVVLRERRSLEELARLGVSGDRVTVTSDLAFLVEPHRSIAVEAAMARYDLQEGRFAVVAVRRHPYLGTPADERLLSEVALAVRAVLDEGVVDRVAVVAHTMGPTPVEDDRAFSARLAEVAAHPSVCLVTDDFAPQEAAALYGAARFLVGVRLHAVILALLSGTPAYAVSYFTAKAPGIMADLGLDGFVADFADFTAEDFRARLPQLLAPELRHDIRRRLDGLRHELRAVVSSL